MRAHDAIGLLLETITWIGIAAGSVCLVVALVIRLADGKWVETTAVILRAHGHAQARWMTVENTIHSRQLERHEDDQCDQSDAMLIFYSRHMPERMRVHPRSNGERMSWLLFFLIGGAGLCSFVVSIVLLFFPT